MAPEVIKRQSYGTEVGGAWGVWAGLGGCGWGLVEYGRGLVEREQFEKKLNFDHFKAVWMFKIVLSFESICSIFSCDF